MASKRFLMIAGLAALFFVPLKATAHPHVWIDMQTAVLFTETGKVSGLRVYWLFDHFYSAVLKLRVEELKKAGKKDPYGLFVHDMLGRLQPHGFFTEAAADGKRLDLKAGKNARMGEMTEKEVEGRVWVEFDLTLRQPLDPRKQKFVYAVYDPTFYIEVLHREKKPAITLAGEGAKGCATKLIKPQPDEQKMAFAASLDKTESGGDGLGKFFAEKVALSCR